LGSAEVLLVRQIVDQFAPGLFAQAAALLVVMSAFARTELEQIGRKMARNEYFGASIGNALQIIGHTLTITCLNSDMYSCSLSS